MTEFENAQLRAAVERMYGGRATFVQSVPVDETFDGKTVWVGVVYVSSTYGETLTLPAPTRGHRRLREARVADSLPCSTWGELPRRSRP